MQTYQLETVGGLFQLAAVILSGVLGFRGESLLMGALIGGVLFAIGYLFDQLPQLIGLYRSDGFKVIWAFLLLVIVYGVNNQAGV